jgi:hypothetical protein
LKIPGDKSFLPPPEAGKKEKLQKNRKKGENALDKCGKRGYIR